MPNVDCNCSTHFACDCFMQRRRELETEVMALKAELDQLRAQQPARCGECGHELTLVRPGKYQCDWCEGETVMTSLLQENQALRADLADIKQKTSEQSQEVQMIALVGLLSLMWAMDEMDFP